MQCSNRHHTGSGLAVHRIGARSPHEHVQLRTDDKCLSGTSDSKSKRSQEDARACTRVRRRTVVAVRGASELGTAVANAYIV